MKIRLHEEGASFFAPLRLCERPNSRKGAKAQRETRFAGSLPARWREPFEASFGHGFKHVEAIACAEADKHLARAGALALALDRKTILFSTKLRGWPLEARLKIIGHELAHTVQMSRGGCDRSEFLETEAWSAAEAALRGERYRIRGRASERDALPAVAFVMDQFGSNYFQTYKQMGFFKIAMLEITDTVVVSPMIFESVLDKMTDTFDKERYFVLWSHGNPNGFGMPLAKDTTLKAHEEPLRLLNVIHEIKADIKKAGDDLAQWGKLLRKSGLLQPPKDLDEARAMMTAFVDGVIEDFAIENKITLKQLKKVVDRITDKMFALHKKKMGVIEIRACNIGVNPDGMKVFRQFFGVEALGAPDLRASFGFLVPGIGDSAYKSFEKRFPTARTKFDKLYTGRFGIQVLIPKGSTVANIYSAATSRLTLTEWTYDYISANVNKLNPMRVPIHFLVKEPPAFQGDIEYWEHIKYAMSNDVLCPCLIGGPVQ